MAYGGVPWPSLEPGVKQQLFGSNQNSELEQVEEPVVAGAVDVGVEVVCVEDVTVVVVSLFWLQQELPESHSWVDGQLGLSSSGSLWGKQQDFSLDQYQLPLEVGQVFAELRCSS